MKRILSAVFALFTLVGCSTEQEASNPATNKWYAKTLNHSRKLVDQLNAQNWDAIPKETNNTIFLLIESSKSKEWNGIGEYRDSKIEKHTISEGYSLIHCFEYEESEFGPAQIWFEYECSDEEFEFSNLYHFIKKTSANQTTHTTSANAPSFKTNP